jgi:two-component system, NarL family, nitrate/nitrite response regulator NarL
MTKVIDVATRDVTVVVADDHALFRRGMARAIGAADGLALVGEAADGSEALRLIEELEPDVALVDLRMPHMDGAEICEHLARRQPPLPTRVVLISAAFRGRPGSAPPREGAALALSKELTRDEICRELLALGGDAA